MRTLPCLLALLLLSVPTGLYADCPITDLVTVIDSNLSLEVIAVGPGQDAFWDGVYNAVTGGRYSEVTNPGHDAVGNLYTADGEPPRIIWRTSAQGVRAQILTIDYLEHGPGCDLEYSNGFAVNSVDGWLDIPMTGTVQGFAGRFLLRLRGLPSLLEVLLSYQPAPAAIGIAIPRFPDGLRSADSLQVWTGNVRSMPDWSQAEPLTCEAATNPVPGQVVTVADTLPNPPVGEGRYYLVASQNGADRRLGRQYVNGAFWARQPAGLPACH